MPWRSAPASDTTEPPTTPEVNLASDGDITVTANPAPHAPLTVTVGVPTDDYAVAAPGACWSRGGAVGSDPHTGIGTAGHPLRKAGVSARSYNGGHVEQPSTAGREVTTHHRPEPPTFPQNIAGGVDLLGFFGQALICGHLRCELHQSTHAEPGGALGKVVSGLGRPRRAGYVQMSPATIAGELLQY